MTKLFVAIGVIWITVVFITACDNSQAPSTSGALFHNEVIIENNGIRIVRIIDTTHNIVCYSANSTSGRPGGISCVRW